MNTPDLAARLAANGAAGPLPMHMPGHKRNLTCAPFLAALGGGLDITEIDGFDDLHNPEGVLREEMARAAALWGADRSFFLVNGSTCGLLAAIYATAGNGGRAIVARNCHKAVYHALELCGLTPQYLLPNWCAPLGIWGSVDPAEVERALDKTPGARFVLLTSPTYEGILSDISAIAALCHAKRVPLIVDEAHGAHLGFGGFLPGAVSQGADIAVQSAHKTLPSLTQTALLHVKGPLVRQEAVERALNMFETSSPSYLLLASLSGCMRFLEKPDCFASWRAGLAAFDREIAGLCCLKIPMHGSLSGQPWPDVFAWDESKLFLPAWAGGWSGFSFMEALRSRFSIELEMAQPHYALAMTGAGDGTESLTRLAHALCVLDRRGSGDAVPLPGLPPDLPPVRMSMKQALSVPAKACSLTQAVGRVSAQYLWAYPPGVPLLVPGEEVTETLADQLESLARGGTSLHSSPRGRAGTLWVTAE